MSRAYGLPELVDALVRARAGQPGSFLSLSKALRLDPDTTAQLAEGRSQSDPAGYGLLLDRVLESLSAEWDPFSGVLEAPSGFIRLAQHHGDPVRRTTDRARKAVRAVGVDALVFLCRVPRDVRVRGAEAEHLDAYFREPGPEDW